MRPRRTAMFDKWLMMSLRTESPIGLTHAWRDQLGVLGEDAWHEEWIANCVAFAYVREHQPECAEAVLTSSRRLLEGQSPDDATRRDALVSRARTSSKTPADYDMSVEDAARVHAHMLHAISEESLDVSHCVEAWLLPNAEPSAAE